MPQNLHNIFGAFGILGRESPPVGSLNLPQVIARRSTPGLLIFTTKDELVYINAEARKVLASFGIHQSGFVRADGLLLLAIPEPLTNLCNQLRRMVSSSSSPTLTIEQNHTPSVQALLASRSESYSFRAFFLSNNLSYDRENAYILVLIEQISLTRKIDIQKAAQRFKLSKREIEVIELLILGHKNKEIAERLSVCVYTIEDHLKKIMKKMQVVNRTSILAKLLD
jgi:DNA-binding CsgD family transcriptional regulator